MLQKFIFSSFLLFASPTIFAQISDADFFVLEREMRGVRQITERHHRAGTCCRGHWKSVFFYDENGFLLRRVNKRRRWVFHRTTADFRFQHTISDTLLVVKSQEIRRSQRDYIIRKFYFNYLEQCYRFEIFLPNFSLHSSGKPQVIGDNFIYKDGLLQSFDRHVFLWRDSLELFVSDRHIFTHDSSLRIEQIYRNIHTDTAFMDDCITIFIYLNGKLTDRKFKCNGEFIVMTGGSGLPIRFSNFDRNENWRRSYFITESGRKLLRSVRRIRYW
jgi:hypothetical protein